MAVFLADGERILRTYKCAKVDFNSTDSTLEAFGLMKRNANTDCTVTVTNRRIIYFAETDAPSRNTGMPSMHSQEAFIDKIDSLEFMQAEVRGNSIFPFLIVLLGLFLTVIGAFEGKPMYLVPGLTILIIGAAIYVPAVLKVKKTMVMKINTLSSGEGIHVSGLSKKQEDSLTFYMLPNEEFARMSRELGAIILDIQSSSGEIIRIGAVD